MKFIKKRLYRHTFKGKFCLPTTTPYRKYVVNDMTQLKRLSEANYRLY